MKLKKIRKMRQLRGEDEENGIFENKDGIFVVVVKGEVRGKFQGERLMEGWRCPSAAGITYRYWLEHA
jgi:hypothetical protein